MRYPFFTIAYFTLLESLRAMRVIIPVLLLILATSFFVRELAIIEADRMQTVFLGAVTRLALIFILGLFVVVSVVREFNDKGLELILALDLPRSSYVLGKFLGYAVTGFLLTIVACLLLMWFVHPGALLIWAGFLLLELMILIALSLFAAIAFTNVVPATSFVLGFYVLARSITAIQLISESPLAAQDAGLQNIVSGLIRIIALFIPRLSDFTQTAWLVNSAPASTIDLSLLAHGALFLVLVLAAAAFDIYHKDF